MKKIIFALPAAFCLVACDEPIQTLDLNCDNILHVVADVYTDHIDAEITRIGQDQYEIRDPNGIFSRIALFKKIPRIGDNIKINMPHVTNDDLKHPLNEHETGFIDYETKTIFIYGDAERNYAYTTIQMPETDNDDTTISIECYANIPYVLERELPDNVVNNLDAQTINDLENCVSYVRSQLWYGGENASLVRDDGLLFDVPKDTAYNVAGLTSEILWKDYFVNGIITTPELDACDVADKLREYINSLPDDMGRVPTDEDIAF